MKKLLVFLKDYQRESILSPFFKLLEACFELTIPLIVAAIIDTGIGGENKKYIVLMCGLMVLLYTVGLVCSVTAQYFAAKASTGFATKARGTLFSHIGKLSYSQLDRLGTPTLVTRLTADMNQVQTGVNFTLRLLLRSPVVVVGSLIFAMAIDKRTSLVFLAAILILAVVVYAVMAVSIPIYEKVQKNTDSVLSATRENLLGTRVVRAFCKEEEDIAAFSAKTEVLYKIQHYAGKISALLNPVTFLIINIAVIALIYTGAVRVGAGILTQGAVVALYNYMAGILVELIKFVNLVININKSIASGDRVQAVLDIKPDLISGDQKTLNADAEYAVEFDQVSLRYQNGSEDMLSGISFKVKRGQTVGIIGATGSGKSSLINLIPRFYDATEGLVRVNGIDVKQLDLDTLRAKIGIVPQKAVLFSGSIRENLLWGNENAEDEDIYTALRAAQAEEIVNEKRGKLDFMIEQGGKNLSGGQKQRLTIARALLKKPEILILDDSGSALDYATEAALRQAIGGLPFSPTVFTVSQRASSLIRADQIIVLDDGEISAIGTSDELLKTSAIYREIYETQFQPEVRNEK